MPHLDTESLTRDGLVSLEQASRVVGLPRQTLWGVLRRLGLEVRRVGGEGGEISAITADDLARLREVTSGLDPGSGEHGLAELTSRDGGRDGARLGGARPGGGLRALEHDLLEARRLADHWRALEERTRTELERAREELARARAECEELRARADERGRQAGTARPPAGLD